MKARLIFTLVAASTLALAVTGSTNSQPLKGKTRTTVASSAKRPVYGQKVTFTATVTRRSGTGKLSGKVMFYDGVILVGVAALRPAEFLRATFVTSVLAVRTHSIRAVYSGNSKFGGGASRVLTVKCDKSTTTQDDPELRLASVFGQPVTLTTTVRAVKPSTAIPKGSVQFKDGGVFVATADVDANANAIYKTSTLGVGTHVIVATYTGGTNFKSSTASPLTVTVGKASTTLTVVGSVNDSPAELSVTFTVTVTPVGPGAGAPSGTIQFANGNTYLGSTTVNQGTLTTKLPRGTQTVTATYSGDGNFTGSSSSVKVTA